MAMIINISPSEDLKNLICWHLILSNPINRGLFFISLYGNESSMRLCPSNFQFVDHFLLLFCVSRVTLAKQRTLTSSLRGCPWRRPPRTPPPSTSCPTSRAMSLKGSALPTQNSVLQSCCSLC